MLFVVPFWIDLSVPWAVFALALLVGSAPERIVAATCGLALAYNTFVQPHHAGEMLPLNLVEHVIEFAVITGLALAYDRWWLLVAAATQLVIVATVVGAMLAPLRPWASGTALWTWAWIFIAALAVGTWRAGRAKTPALLSRWAAAARL